jgi:effector-binding domain-containing protein
MAKAKRKQPLGQTIGGVLFGFEQQIFRNQPPPHELVHHARPDDPVPAGDGGFVTIDLPVALPVPSGTGAPPEPEVRDLAPQPAVAVRVRQPMAVVDVGALVDRHLPGLAARMPALGLAVEGPPYVRYRDWGDETADLELGFPVDAEAASLPLLDACRDGEPGRSSLPGGPCAVIVHVGPYRELPASWGRLEAWIWDQGLAPAGPPWESYLDNPGLVAPGAVRTEVIRPLRGGPAS